MSKQEKIFGSILSIIMLLLAIWGFFVFKVFLKASFIQWIMYNVCAPTQITFFIFMMLLSKRPKYLQYFLILVVPLTVFGTMGLFIFPWSGQGALTTQLSHALMTITAGWIIYINRKTTSLSPKVIYWIYGVCILIAIQNWYCRVTADVLKQMLNV
jgi:hypothetical protein